MRTFQYQFQIECRAVVPENFLVEQLEAARAEDCTKFQEQLIAKYDAALLAAAEGAESVQAERVQDAGDDFLLELMSNGMRHGIRGHVLAMLGSSGIGGTCAPVKTLERIALVPEL